MVQHDKFQIACADDLLVLRFAQVQAVAENEVLHRGIDQVGDVAAQIDVLADAGGTDVLQMGGQLQLQHLARDAVQIRVNLVSLRVAGAAEDHMVQRVDRAVHRRYLVGRGVCHHVAAHGEVQFPSLEYVPQPLEVLRRGKVHGNVMGEKVHVKHVRHGHAGDLPANQGGLCLF